MSWDEVICCKQFLKMFKMWVCLILVHELCANGKNAWYNTDGNLNAFQENNFVECYWYFNWYLWSLPPLSLCALPLFVPQHYRHTISQGQISVDLVLNGQSIPSAKLVRLKVSLSLFLTPRWPRHVTASFVQWRSRKDTVESYHMHI